MKIKSFYILILILFISHACNSQPTKPATLEQTDIRLFDDFKNYFLNTIQKKEDIIDSAHLRYVLMHFIFINKKTDSAAVASNYNNELSTSEEANLKKELNVFYNFLSQNTKSNISNNLTIKPIRNSRDSFIYNRLTYFQKENTFVMYDKRFPDSTLGYILFIPPIKKIIDSPRIWSWTLIFKFGKYMFKDLTGEEGYEYIFSPEKFKR